MEKVAFNDEMTENTKVTVGSVAIIWQKIVSNSVDAPADFEKLLCQLRIVKL